MRTGEAIPVDGLLDSEVAVCDESLLTGEAVSVRHQRGEAVVAGAINLGAPITVRATATAAASTAQRLLLLTDNAAKPEALAFADVVARFFMPALLLLAVGTFVALLPAGVSTATERAIAVLIISCPCALALAALQRRHARSPDCSAAAWSCVVPRRLSVLLVATRFAGQDRHTIGSGSGAGYGIAPGRYGIVCSEHHRRRRRRAANHPLAVALRGSGAVVESVTDAAWLPGQGVSGTIGGRAYRFGRGSYVGRCNDDNRSERRLWLTDDQGTVCSLDLSERLREDAPMLVRQLQGERQGGAAEWRPPGAGELRGEHARH